jgi:hypothetical protein
LISTSGNKIAPSLLKPQLMFPLLSPVVPD